MALLHPEGSLLVGTLRRVRLRQRTRFVAEPPPTPVRRPARVAVMLALGHRIQAALDRGTVTGLTEVAQRLGFSPARITQLVDLMLLAPDIQEQLLQLEAVDGVEPISERALRAVVHAGTWQAQWSVWRQTAPLVIEQSPVEPAPSL